MSYLAAHAALISGEWRGGSSQFALVRAPAIFPPLSHKINHILAIIDLSPRVFLPAHRMQRSPPASMRHPSSTATHTAGTADSVLGWRLETWAHADSGSFTASARGGTTSMIWFSESSHTNQAHVTLSVFPSPVNDMRGSTIN
jgi:hypothetical protein